MDDKLTKRQIIALELLKGSRYGIYGNEEQSRREIIKSLDFADLFIALSEMETKG